MPVVATLTENGGRSAAGWDRADLGAHDRCRARSAGDGATDRAVGEPDVDVVECAATVAEGDDGGVGDVGDAGVEGLAVRRHPGERDDVVAVADAGEAVVAGHRQRRRADGERQHCDARGGGFVERHLVEAAVHERIITEADGPADRAVGQFDVDAVDQLGGVVDREDRGVGLRRAVGVVATRSGEVRVAHAVAAVREVREAEAPVELQRREPRGAGADVLELELVANGHPRDRLPVVQQATFDRSGGKRERDVSNRVGLVEGEHGGGREVGAAEEDLAA